MPISKTAFMDVVVMSILLILSSIIAFIVIPSVSAYTFDQQEQVCSTLNLSFVGCYEFWDSQNKSCLVYNYTNETIYLNNCTQCTENCSEQFDYKQQELDHEFRMAELNKEPVISTDSSGITKDDINDVISSVISSLNKPQTNSDSEIPPWLIWFLVIGSIVGYFLFKSFKRVTSQRFPDPSFSSGEPSPMINSPQLNPPIGDSYFNTDSKREGTADINNDSEVKNLKEKVKLLERQNELEDKLAREKENEREKEASI
jgi:hypothetical protein